MSPEDDPILAAIDRAVFHRARSSLSRWMFQNHAAFAARYISRLTDWSVLVRVFTEAGLTDARGNDLTPLTARKTWERVQRKMRESPTAAAVALPASVPAPRLSDFLLPVEPEPEPEQPRQLRKASMRRSIAPTAKEQ